AKTAQRRRRRPLGKPTRLRPSQLREIGVSRTFALFGNPSVRPYLFKLEPAGVLERDLFPAHHGESAGRDVQCPQAEAEHDRLLGHAAFETRHDRRVLASQLQILRAQIGMAPLACERGRCPLELARRAHIVERSLLRGAIGAEAAPTVTRPPSRHGHCPPSAWYSPRGRST